MKPKPFMIECFFCKADFQFGPGIYAGKPIKPWGINICNTCRASHREGFVLNEHPELKRLLESKGIDTKTEDGVLKWPQ